ncbi:hypothetical protein SGPA1_40798 [Streptomyces misionensis JCM 4497]
MGRRLGARRRRERRHRADRGRPVARHGGARLPARPLGPRLLLALLRRAAAGPRRFVPRADAGLPGRHVRIRRRRGPVQRLRVLRADERGGLRPDRPPHRRGQGGPGGADLRRRQLAGRVRPVDGHRAAVRPHRRTVHDEDRPGPRQHGRPRRARRAGPGRVRAGAHRAAGQSGHRALPLLAPRRPRRRPHPGVHAAVRRDGRTRRVRRLAGLRHRLRRPRRHSGRRPDPRPADARCAHRRHRRRHVLVPAAHQTAARLLHHRPHRPVPRRRRRPHPRGRRRRRPVHPRPRRGEGRAVRLCGRPAGPVRQRGRTRAARPGGPAACHRRAVRRRRSRPRGPAAVRHRARQGGQRGGGRRPAHRGVRGRLRAHGGRGAPGDRSRLLRPRAAPRGHRRLRDQRLRGGARDLRAGRPGPGHHDHGRRRAARRVARRGHRSRLRRPRGPLGQRGRLGRCPGLGRVDRARCAARPALRRPRRGRRRRHRHPAAPHGRARVDHTPAPPPVRPCRRLRRLGRGRRHAAGRARPARRARRLTGYAGTAGTECNDCALPEQIPDGVIKELPCRR